MTATDGEAGGHAFPCAIHEGMTLRDYFAAQAPIDARTAMSIYGCDMPQDDAGRAAFMAVWALLRYEYADAMLEQRKQ